MKTLIIYYSYTGNTRKIAEQYRTEHPEMDIYEIKEKKRHGMFYTYMVNCPKAALRKNAEIEKITVDINEYDKLIVFMPVWNSHPVPFFNTLLNKIPSCKKMELFLCSGGGETEKSKASTCKYIRDAGFTLINYHDIKTVGIIQKKGDN